MCLHVWVFQVAALCMPRLAGVGRSRRLPFEHLVVKNERSEKMCSCMSGCSEWLSCACPVLQVYIWHRHGGALLEVLPGHAGTVNDVAWSPVEPLLFASCSDDHTVRLWGKAA